VISVLGYNATTSFALLSIPISLPANIFGIDPVLLAFKVSLFLPVVSVGIALALLWILGGKESIKKGFWSAMVAGLSLALSCLLFTGMDVALGYEIVPLATVGIFAGLVSMFCTVGYQRLTKKDVKKGKLTYSRKEILRAFSPWIILTLLACVISIPQLSAVLKDLPGSAEVIYFYNKPVDLNIFSQIYFWIFISVILTVIVLRPKGEVVKRSFKVWSKRMVEPFFAYSLYFSISFVMAWSAMHVVDGNLVPSEYFNEWNMNIVLGTTLAAAFGVGFIFVAASLGLFGAVVSGSETGSNVMFYEIQKNACSSIGVAGDRFLTVYAAHAATGGVASAITPAKITNAVAVIGEERKMESEVMRKHLLLVFVLTIAIGIMTGIFVELI